VFGAQTGQAVELAAQLRQGIAHRQWQKVLGLLVTRAGVQRLALQPGTGDPPDVQGLGTEIGEVLVKVVNMHGARMLPLCALAAKRGRLGGPESASVAGYWASTRMASAELRRMTT
jgi:hypothetical protein